MRVPLTDLRVDDSIQARVALSLDTVTEYADCIRRGDEFPPVTAFKDAEGVLWLADGFHRYHAHREAGAVDIEADVRDGSHRDARLFAIRANQQHGLRRTRADKAKALDALLLDPEWQMWSDSCIAKEVGVDPHTVKSHRTNMGIPKLTEVVVYEKDGTQYTMDTGAIGKARVETVSTASLLGALEFAGRAFRKGTGDARQPLLFPPEPAPEPPFLAAPAQPPPRPNIDKLAAALGVKGSPLFLNEAMASRLMERMGALELGELSPNPAPPANLNKLLAALCPCVSYWIGEDEAGRILDRLGDVNPGDLATKPPRLS